MSILSILLFNKSILLSNLFILTILLFILLISKQFINLFIFSIKLNFNRYSILNLLLFLYFINLSNIISLLIIKFILIKIFSLFTSLILLLLSTKI